MQPKTYFSSIRGVICPLVAFTLLTVNFLMAETPYYHAVMVDAGPDQNICLGESVQLNASGANSYTWSPPNGLSCTNCPDPVASPTTTTAYEVMGDDGTVDTVVVNVFTEPDIVSVSTGDPTDCNLPNGSVVINADGNGALEYSIDGGNIWSASPTFTALPSGNYMTAVRYVGGACFKQGPSATLQAPSAPEILTVAPSNPTLCDNPNGAIIISATDGIPPLEYSIDGGQTWQGSNTFQLLPSGNYDTRVRNNNGSCEISGGTFTLTGSPDEPNITQILEFGPSACGASDGLITVLVSNDNGNFEYSIDGGNSYQPTNSFPSLEEGVYEIIVRRNDGTCSSSGGFVDLFSSSRPSYFGVSVVDPTSCGETDGNITVLAFGPSTLEFTINGGATWQFSNIFPDLAAGFYQVAIRNTDGTCFTMGDDVLLEQPPAPVISNVFSNDPSGCGADDGSITIEAGGSGPLEFSITGGGLWSSTNSFFNLGEDQYTIVVRLEGTNCMTNFINNPVVLTSTDSPPTITDVDFTDPSDCGVDDGSIFIEANGNGALEYSIDNGATWSSSSFFDGLGDGNFNVKVRIEGSNCEADYINNPLQLDGGGNVPIITDVNFTDPSGCGADDGSIFIEANGNGTLEYSIDNGATWSTSSFFGNLSNGDFNIKVRVQGSNCEADYINNPVQLDGGGNVPTILDVNATQPSGCGMEDGEITVSAVGISLEYSIDGGLSWQPGALFEDLGGGDYVIAVREEGTGCEAFYNANPIQLLGGGMIPDITDVEVVPISDCGQSDGSILISATGSGQLEFSIDNGATWTTNPAFSFLGQGSYSIKVREAGTNCEATYQNNPVQLTSNGIVPIINDVDANDPGSCGATDGSIIINATGTGNMEFSIDNGANWQPNPSFTGLGTGFFNITVREAGTSCQAFYQNNPVVLNSSGVAPVIQNVNATDPTDCNISDGTIFINVVSGGTFEYSIDNGNTFVSTPAFFDLPDGDYEIVVRELGSGCETIFQDNPVQLNGPGVTPVITNLNINQPSTCGVNDGSVIIDATGSGQLEYSIDNGMTFQLSNAFNGLGAGVYNLVISQSGGQCDLSETVSLSNVQTCLDTVSFTVTGNQVSTVCLDASVFDFPGLFTSVGFCMQGNANTVLATSISGECLDVEPAIGYLGTSPDLICTVHCFNNNPDQCDTTYIEIIVADLNCDPVFPIDTVEVDYIGSATSYCVPIPLSSIPNYDLTLQGLPLTNAAICDLDQTVAYSYGFLPDGGTAGPYTVNSWEINGSIFTGNFDDPQEMVDLMNDLDPSGFWQINASGSIIFGGNPNSTYGDMDIVQNSSNIPTVLMTNFTFQPQGFSIGLPTSGEYILIASDPVTGCIDTLVINAAFEQPGTEIVTLTTTANVPTAPYCLDGSDLPTNAIINIGFCGGPTNGVAPLATDSCVFYVPNLNFAGQDEFCMIVCDGGFPQICDTTIFIVNVIPEQDTVFLNIPSGATQVDTCFNNFIIELPDVVDQASFCDIDNNELDGTVSGNCVSFTAVNNFVGVSEVCVEFCSNGICDQTIVFVNVGPPIDCPDIFTQDIDVVPTVTTQGFYCIPISPGDIVNYETTIDGVLFNAFTPCDFGNVLFYNYSSLAPGSLTLNSWTVNGTVFSGSFNDIQELVDSMNAWDPTGGWDNNQFGLTITGGDPNNTYGNLDITDNLNGMFDIVPDVVILPLGSSLEVNGIGGHQVIITDANDCSDTITIVVQPYQVTTDTLFFETNLNTTVVPICATSQELLGNVNSFNFCSLPTDGAVGIVGDTCVSYTPSLNYVGSDEFCLVVCDDFSPVVCDTFIVIINTQLPTDTVFVDANNITPFDECLDGTVIQLPANIDTAFACGFDPAAVSIAFAGNCVNIDLEDTFVGTTTACVVHCADAPFTICDTTILIIEFDGSFPCDDLFVPDQANVALVNNIGEICIPLDAMTLNDYDIFLDGNVYTGSLVGCDVDSIYTYFYAQVFGGGNAGPYDIEWTLNGTVQTGTVNDMAALVNLMNGFDPAGLWMLDQTAQTISSSNDSGDYGVLQISHSSGSVSGLTANFNGFPNGSLITFTGAGAHELVLVHGFTQCDDTLFINAVGDVDTIEIVTLEDTPSTQECIDITGLPSNFVEMTVCGSPANGTLLLDDECFIYFPAAGFSGMDEACFQICDDLGNCEIWIVLITVDPLCGQFVLFPDGVVDLSAADCSDSLEYCIPIELDSMTNFSIMDNGVAISDFESCNGTFTQVSIDTGFHEIIVQHVMTGCADTLQVNVACAPDNDCGASPLSSLDLLVSDCTGLAEVCFDIPVAELMNKVVLDNGAQTFQVDTCSTDNQFIGVSLDTGLHELVIADTVKLCADTFMVNVSCLEVNDTIVDVQIIEGDSTEICLSDYNFPVPAVDSIINVCGNQSDGNATFIIDTTNWCITIYGEMIGMDTFCFKAYFGDTCAILTANVDVTDSCPDYFPDDQLTTIVSCGLDSSLVCIPVDPAILQTLDIEVSGAALTDDLVPCAVDSFLFFPYFDLPSGGILGPFEIKEWVINGDTLTGVFETAAEMAALMTLLDSTGDWMVGTDANGNTIIVGGNFNSSYGTMEVEQTMFGNIEFIDILTGVNVLEYGITLPLGATMVSFTDPLTNCTEDIIVDVLCVESDTIIQDIEITMSDTFCLDLTELMGNVVSVENVCTDLSGTDVDFEIDGECVIFTGLDAGTDTACIVVCDDLDICDTTYFWITTVLSTNDTMLVAVDDEVVTGEEQVILIDVLQNDETMTLSDFFIVDQPQNGQAAFLPNGMVNYDPNDGFCDDETPDVFTYAICNSLGCDTATVTVFVFCDNLEIYNGFSPNGDQKNDFFRIKGLQSYPDHHLFVYNRWGNLVYDAVDYQSDWFGTWNERVLPDGTYFYVLDLGNGEEALKGYVQIRR